MVAEGIFFTFSHSHTGGRYYGRQQQPQPLGRKLCLPARQRSVELGNSISATGKSKELRFTAPLCAESSLHCHTTGWIWSVPRPCQAFNQRERSNSHVPLKAIGSHRSSAQHGLTGNCPWQCLAWPLPAPASTLWLGCRQNNMDTPQQKKPRAIKSHEQ